MNIKEYFYNRKNIVYLSLIILFGATLRLYNLGVESFWFDEIFTVHLVSQDLRTFIQQLITQGSLTRNAVYYLLAYFWVLPYKLDEISIRSLSVIFGVLSIGMIYLVGKQLFGKKVGLLSSFFMAISWFQIYYSQEARFYSLFVMLTLVSLHCYILALRTKQSRLWFIGSLVNILLFYTHTYAVFIFTAEYIHYLVYWKNNKNTLFVWALSQLLLMLALSISLAPLFVGGELTAGFGSGLAWITTPTLRDLLGTVYNYLFPQNYQHSWFFIAASFAVGSTFFILGAFLFSFRKIKNCESTGFEDYFRNIRLPFRISSELMLTALWFVCPIVIPFIYSCVFTSVYQDRYTICAAPAFYLLTALVVSKIDRIVPSFVSLLALMIVILPGLLDYYAAPVNEQWREAAIFVQENARTDDVIVFAPDEEGFQHKSFDWYYQGDLKYCSIDSSVKDDRAIANILSSCMMGHRRFWLIARGPSESVNRFTSYFLSPARAGGRLISERQFVMVSIYLFELSE